MSPASSSVRTLRGEVVLAQEHRFQLVDETGCHWAVALASGVPWGPQDLARLADGGLRVEVTIEASQASRAQVASQLRVLAEDTTR